MPGGFWAQNAVGIWRTTSGGASWEMIGLGSVSQMRKIVLQWHQDNLHLFVASTSGIYECENGLSANPTWSKLVSGNFYDIEFDPQNNGIVYGSGTGANSSVYKLDWINNNYTELPNLASIPQEDGRRLIIEISNAAPNYLFIVSTYWDGLESSFLYRYDLTNNSLVYKGKLPTPSYNPQGVGPERAMGWTISPVLNGSNDLSMVHGNTAPIRQSNNLLDNNLCIWSDVSSSNPLYPYSTCKIHVDMHYMCFEPDGQTLWVGNDGGVFKSTMPDLKNNWEEKNDGLAVATVHHLAISDQNDGVALSGAYDNGSVRYTKSNNLWSEKHVAIGDGFQCIIDWSNPLRMLVSPQFSIHRSIDGGNNFSPIQSGFHWETFFEQNKIFPDVLYGTNEFGVKSSVNFGTTWSNIAEYPNVNDNKTWRVYVSPTDGNYLYSSWYGNSSGSPQKVFKSTTGGGTNPGDWVDVGSPSENHWIKSISVDYFDPNHIWVATNPHVYDVNTLTQEWTDISNGLPSYISIKHLEQLNGTEGVLFAGTNYGLYYYNEIDQIWQHVEGNLPNVTVTDIQIDLENNRIAVSTFGRGVWEAQLPCTTEGNAMIINSNKTWSLNRRISQNVIIEPENTLIINNATIRLTENAKIVVKPGARLIINGSRLTSVCSGPWLGIEVQGNSDEIQAAAYQGVLEINGGTIENAICAVKTYKPDPSMETDPLDPQYSGLEGWTGGMVLATNATFRNNRMGVVFPYYRLGSASFFDACTFETTGDLPDASIPDNFVRMNNIAGVQFFGCVFRNTNPDPDLLPENRGSGIYAYDATLVVSPKCQDANCTTFARGSFSKLYYGIRDLSSGENRTTYLDRQDFVDNFRGVYFGGRNYVEFTRNYIRPYAEQTSQNPQTYGVYFDQCTGYHIEENTFDSENTAKLGIGLIVHKSGQEANEVYRNTFTNLRYASIAQSFNRGRNNEGLCYKCNNFDNNLYDVKISRENASLLSTMDGIAAHQGYYALGNSLAPAGNLFSNIPNNGSFAFYNSANGINYYKHQNPPYPSRTHPVYCQGTGSVYVITVPQTDRTYACPSKLDLGDGTADDRDMMAAASDEATALSAELATLKDGGNTAALAQTVEAGTAAQAIELRDELLAVSPYLTDTVLDASIQQEEALPNALLRDVMVANPQAAKSDELLTKLDNRQTPMPNEMWNEIMGGAAVSGDKENMEAAIGFWKNEEYYRWSRINRRMLINQAVADSMVEEWTNSTLTEARSNLALYYLAAGDPNSGISVLDTALVQLSESSPEWNELVALRGYIQTIATAYPLPDTSMTASFEAITEQSDGLAEALSRNALIQTGALSYNEPILVNEGLKSERTHKHGLKPVNENNTDLLAIYPNPAKGYFVAKVTLSGQSGGLSLISPSGVVVMEKQIEHSSSVTIPVSHLAAGAYTVRLTENGVIKAVVKVTVQ